MLKQNLSKNLEKDEKYIEKGIELFLDMSLNKSDVETNRDKIELLVVILSLLRYKTNDSFSSTDLLDNITLLEDIKKKKNTIKKILMKC